MRERPADRLLVEDEVADLALLRERLELAVRQGLRVRREEHGLQRGRSAITATTKYQIENFSFWIPSFSPSPFIARLAQPQRAQRPPPGGCEESRRVRRIDSPGTGRTEPIEASHRVPWSRKPALPHMGERRSRDEG